MVGLLLTVLGVWAVPASAEAPPVFGPGYHSYLGIGQRGVAASSLETSQKCPSAAVVAGWTAWHFILDAPAEVASLDVAFTLDGHEVTLAGLTARTTEQWATFSPAENFIADPSRHDAYVYTPWSGVVHDAASYNTPDSPESSIVLSHTCGATSSSTPTTTIPTTTIPTTTIPTTATEEQIEIGTALVIEQSPPTSVGVLALVITRSLPATGPSGSLPLTIMGGVLILAGLVSLRLRRATAPPGPHR